MFLTMIDIAIGIDKKTDEYLCSLVSNFNLTEEDFKKLGYSEYLE